MNLSRDSDKNFNVIKILQNKIQDAVFINLIFAPYIFSLVFKYHLFLNHFYDIIFIASLTLCLLSIYGAFIEPNIVITKHIRFNIRDLKERIRIVFFSDLHIGPFKKSSFINRITDTINKLNPDLILIGGDFITGRYETFKYLKPLKNLGAKYPTLAVIGNHDYDMDLPFEKPYYKIANSLVSYLKTLNIKVLRNCSEQIKIKYNILNIIGIDDLWSGKVNIEKPLVRLIASTL